MGLFVAVETLPIGDERLSEGQATSSCVELVTKDRRSTRTSTDIERSAQDAFRKAQSEIIEILNIGEAINSRDFQERCEKDRHLTALSLEASERMQQEFEIKEFIAALPYELAELVDLLEEGLTTRQIAAIKGVAKGTIQYRIEKLRSITRVYLASALAA